LTNKKKLYLDKALENSLNCLKEFLELSKENKTTSNKKLHHLGYKKLMREYNVPACIVHQSRNKAVEIMKSWWKNIRRGKKSHKFPEPKALRIRYDNIVFRLIETDNRKYPYFASILVASRTRIYLPLIVNSDYQEEYIRGLLKGEYMKGSADLVKKDDEFYFYVVIKKEVHIPKVSREFTPVGVDLGINNLACVTVLGKSVKFFSGKRVIWKKRHLNKIKADLQSRKNQKFLKKIKGKERRFINHINHEISSYIIKQAKKLEKAVIVLEDLRYILQRTKVRKKQRYLHNSWAFRQLQRTIQRKAYWEGISVVYVNSKYTSQICPKCFSVNKRKKHLYKCSYCGYQANADFVGSVNIAKRFFEAICLKETAPIDSAVRIANVSYAQKYAKKEGVSPHLAKAKGI